jgi:hypothetical protein
VLVLIQMTREPWLRDGQPTDLRHGGKARNDERMHMTDAVGERPDARRLELFRSVFEPSPLDRVAEAVAVATEHERRIYVERVEDGYRWSLTHAGGGYPLLRITARFLSVDYTRIMVGCRTVADGVCVLCADPSEPTSAESWAVVEFDGPTPVESARERILSALPSQR